MPNPIYILHLTDFHYGKEIDGQLILNDEKIKLFTKRVKAFLELKAREYVDIVCITGDMMHVNGNNTSHKPIIEFIYQLRVSGIINSKTKIYCVPGNHDLNDEEAAKIPDVDELRIACLENIAKKTHPFFNIVDKYSDKFAGCFKNYIEFLNEIEANNMKPTYTGDLFQFNGFDLIDVGNNKNLFISWFNTSWLCLTDKRWNEVCRIGSRFDLKNYDHGKLSPGNILIKPIIEQFNNINKDETIFSLSLSHHDPRLLSSHHIDIDELTEPNYYWHLNKYSLVLNGHTHNNLFNKPFLTSSFDYIPVIEVNLVQNYNIHYKINWSLNKMNQEIIEDKRISIFNDSIFINRLRSNYKLINLLEDMELNNFESIFNVDKIKYERPNQNDNLLDRLNYDLEQKARFRI